MPHAPDVAPDERIVVDRRRPPFCYQTHDALDAIRAAFPERRRATALAIYLALTETANRYGGEAARGGFEAARGEVAERAGVSTDTLDRYSDELVAAGVLVVERRRVGSVNLPNRWLLVEPAAPPGRTVRLPLAAPCGESRTRVRERGEKEKVEERTPLPPSEMGEPPPLVRVGGRNLALDALAEVCGIEEGEPAFGAAIAALNGRTTRKVGAPVEPGIVHLAWREVLRWAADGRDERLDELRGDPERWTEGLAAMIQRKAARYRVEMGEGVFLTPKALRDWWLRLDKPGARGGDIERFAAGG